MKLHKKIIINGTLRLLTGLHIGNSKDSVEIGSVDSPVVRRKDSNEPYIPGSSLKGKMRSLLELAKGQGIDKNGETSFDYNSYKNDKSIPALFGSSGDNGTSARILVRDAYLTKDEIDENKIISKLGWAKKLKDSEFTDLPYTEVKFENVIDRIKGTAKHPRQIERIPAGAEFDIQFVISIINEKQGEDLDKKENDYIELIKAGIRLLEADYIGGSGTRGYGQVKIHIDWDNKNRKSVIHKLAEDFFKIDDDIITTENPNENK